MLVLNAVTCATDGVLRIHQAYGVSVCASTRATATPAASASRPAMATELPRLAAPVKSTPVEGVAIEMAAALAPVLSEVITILS